jgi:hypothetical protein
MVDLSDGLSVVEFYWIGGFIVAGVTIMVLIFLFCEFLKERYGKS